MTAGGVVRTAIVLALAACSGDVDPPWQLDHDRIIAVRATPPHVPAGATAQIDMLLGHKGAPTSTQVPDALEVVSPASLAGALGPGGVITAPGADQLAAARAELGLAADAPVPLEIGVAVAATQLAATKTVWLGDAADNPTLQGVMIADAPPVDPLTVPKLTDIHLLVDADDSVDQVNWLTSAGSMHDYDLHKAYLRVEAKDPPAGELALVLRDGQGGVAWQVWQISAQ